MISNFWCVGRKRWKAFAPSLEEPHRRCRHPFQQLGSWSNCRVQGCGSVSLVYRISVGRCSGACLRLGLGRVDIEVIRLARFSNNHALVD